LQARVSGNSPIQRTRAHRALGWGSMATSPLTPLKLIRICERGRTPCRPARQLDGAMNILLTTSSTRPLSPFATGGTFACAPPWRQVHASGIVIPRAWTLSAQNFQEVPRIPLLAQLRCAYQMLAHWRARHPPPSLSPTTFLRLNNAASTTRHPCAQIKQSRRAHS